MSKAWHVINALKEKGPMTSRDLWNSIASQNIISNKRNYKTLLTALTASRRVSKTVKKIPNNKKPAFLFAPTAHGSNSMSLEQSQSIVAKRVAKKSKRTEDINRWKQQHLDFWKQRREIKKNDDAILAELIKDEKPLAPYTAAIKK
eukprot:TRINITY_DN1067_c0_g1_i2.p1 TRINITY_DN1067_c0_g1~~TRINITY_DN1067_c0_g1_i2.p1  ORF type:complete len:146 (+),score=22.05 TRINITY_DN1067_c0_g1_i2:41-478(+)